MSNFWKHNHCAVAAYLLAMIIKENCHLTWQISTLFNEPHNQKICVPNYHQIYFKQSPKRIGWNYLGYYEKKEKLTKLGRLKDNPISLQGNFETGSKIEFLLFFCWHGVALRCGMPLKEINILISLYFILLIKLSILASGLKILVILFSELTYFKLGLK